MGSYVIGIDIGTGSTKAVAVDRTGKVVATSVAHYPTLHPAAGHCEQKKESHPAFYHQRYRLKNENNKNNPV